MNWLVKEEPTHYGFDAFVKDGKAAWSGVRHFPAGLMILAELVDRLTSRVERRFRRKEERSSSF